MKMEKLFNCIGYAGQTGKLGNVIQKLKDGKVDKIEGKELSSNDFTDDYKAYLDSVMSSNE